MRILKKKQNPPNKLKFNTPLKQDSKGKIMPVETSTDADYKSWLILAEEVEPLFGPMHNEKEFQAALMDSLKNEEAFCIRAETRPAEVKLVGGIIISKRSTK